jgi:hypothetical protein
MPASVQIEQQHKCGEGGMLMPVVESLNCVRFVPRAKCLGSWVNRMLCSKFCTGQFLVECLLTVCTASASRRLTGGHPKTVALRLLGVPGQLKSNNMIIQGMPATGVEPACNLGT